jgi:enterochelin esterase family protein
MGRYYLVLILIFNFIFSESQNFQHFIEHINALPPANRQAVTDSFIKVCPAFPYIENDSVAHFIYTGAAVSAAMAGDATHWSPDREFTLIDGTSFRYFTKNYEADARLDYKFVIDGKDWISDPRNPNLCKGGFGTNSELRMGKNVKPPETDYYQDMPHGTIKDTIFHSRILDNTRIIKIYLPPDYPAGASGYPLILFHDGPDYLNLASVNNILDYLIAHKMIIPVIAVFVPGVNRDAEYAGKKIDLFTDFISTELMPFIDRGYKTSRDPSMRATIGASNGGNIALYLGLKKPGLFGKIAAQSSNVIPAIDSILMYGPKLKLELYTDIGTYDIAELIPLVHHFTSLLQSGGYPFTFREIHEGHSWGNWKEHLKIPLMQFFPYTLKHSDKENQHPDHSK